MRRRDFLSVLGGAAAAWPVSAYARERMRRIGVLMALAEHDPVGQARVATFVEGLAQAGLIVGRDVQMEIRWSAGGAAGTREHAEELVALAPDVILASGSAAAAPLLQATRTLPIVFAVVPDPVGAGFISSLARPGGNATGFLAYEYSLPVKWLELLKQIAPDATRVAVLRDAALASGIGQFAALQSVAPSFSVELSPINVRDAVEIERDIAAFARSPNGMMIVAGSALANVHRDLLIRLAARYKLPAAFNERFFVTGGGLLSYGPDFLDQYHRAAGYVDRILKGEKPADLPVQAPVKYNLAINLKTARALGVTVPPTVLSVAHEVIE